MSLEQAAERHRAVAWMPDDVELVVGGRQIADLMRGVEVEVARGDVAEPPPRDRERGRPRAIRRRAVVAEVDGLEQPAVDEPRRQIAQHRVGRASAAQPSSAVVSETSWRLQVVGDRHRLAARHRARDRQARGLGAAARELGEAGEREHEHVLRRAHRLVVIDLRVHVRAREQVLLDGVAAAAVVDDESPRAGPDGVGIVRDLDRVDDPVEVVGRVARAGVMTVAQQVVEAIDVELRRHQLARVAGDVALVPERAQRVGQRGVERGERGVELAILGDDARAPVLVVVARQHVLPRVRERTVADVVEQRRDLDVARDRRREVEPPRHPLRDVERPERVAEPRVLGAGVHQPREPHLLDAPQPLHRGGVEQLGDRPVRALELDQAVHRVAEHAVLGHGRILQLPRSIADFERGEGRQSGGRLGEVRGSPATRARRVVREVDRLAVGRRHEAVDADGREQRLVAAVDEVAPHLAAGPVDDRRAVAVPRELKQRPELRRVRSGTRAGRDQR